jgi:methyltransferase (TIGR00027 family)
MPSWRWPPSPQWAAMMADRSPSVTAQRVAAYRLGFERVPAPYGDPDADDALARDVAGSDLTQQSDGMARYLRGRTMFFDRVITSGMARHITQVVSIGAGYDGRSLRYAAPGVRWWEVDHPDTQADKQLRLERLGIDVSYINFVGHDLCGPGLALALVSSGYDTNAPSVIVCEGVAVYLDLPELESMLSELRSLATAGTRLALSLSGTSSSPDHATNRERFEAAVAGVGEVARNALNPTDAVDLFASTGWRSVELSDKASSAGFVMTIPVWAPVSDEPTASIVEEASTIGSTGTEMVRAFLPSKDFEASKAFYRALGFETVLDADVAIFRAGVSQFILTRYFQTEYAENMMMQLVVDDLDAWWTRLESLDLAKRFGVRPPTAPAIQTWGLQVTFVVDPSGILWHFVQR